MRGDFLQGELAGPESSHPLRRPAEPLPLPAAGALFIQPHYDDAALSCGGAVACVAQAGVPAHIITVFASEIVDQMVGDFAAWKHSRWKVQDVDDVVNTRRSEDSAAAGVLGAPLRWLGMPDAIYRGDRYQSDSELYGPLRDEELELARFLAHEIRGLPEWRPGATVFVPLGAGNHVDHQLVFEAGRVLAAEGETVYAYEDLPYAIHTPQGLVSRLAQVEPAVAGPYALELGPALERKLDAIACYHSQLPVIFRFTDDFRSAVTGYARSVGRDGAPSERYWRVRAGTGLTPGATR